MGSTSPDTEGQLYICVNLYKGLEHLQVLVFMGSRNQSVSMRDNCMQYIRMWKVPFSPGLFSRTQSKLSFFFFFSVSLLPLEILLQFPTICIECGFLLILPSWGLWPPDYEYLHFFFLTEKNLENYHLLTI